MSIIPQKLCLSDEEDEQEMLDDKEPDLFSTDIRKNLVDEFTAKTPMRLTRQSINHKREHMKVFLRIRPFTGEEIGNGEEQDCMHISKQTTLTMRAPKDSFAFKSSMRGCQEMTHNFTFTGIYGPETSQKSFFDDTMLASVKSVIDGQNCLVFTYGVTNAGKTYTIQGLPQDGGILPRTLDVIFNSIDGRHFDSMQLKPKYFCDVMKLTEKQVQAEEAVKSSVLAIANSSSPQGIEPDSLEASDIESSKLSNNSTVYEDSLTSDTSTVNDADATQSLINDIRSRIPDDTSVDVEAQGPIKFSVWVSFAEIYNEYIYDLLEAVPKGKKVRRQALKLSEDKHGSIFIKGLKEIQVSNADEAYKVLKIGQKNLSIAATKLNHNSSRSHCIFSIKILRVVDVADPHIARVSKISFCDLAGSERSTKTQSEGDRLKEAGNINTSLLTLGKCIHALRYNQNHSNAHPKVIPFRESKLTRLFQSFFLGKGLASMVVNVNQCASMFDETMHVLKFSAIAKQVTTVTSKLDNKWQMPKVKKLISARALSLVVDKSLSSNTSRTSIPWATPRTMAREVQRASDLTRIDESMIEEEDEDDEEEDELEETLNDDRTPVDAGGVAGASRVALIGLVDVLKNELVEAKKQLQTMETQIRAEVCEEMAKQLVEIEASYNERLQEEKEMVEEVYEKKMEILTKSVKKTHSKKPRTHQDDEDFVPAMVHASLQAKVEEKEDKIAELTKELERRAAEISKLEKAKDGDSKMEGVASDTNKLQEQIEIGERKIEELVAEKLAMEKEMTVEKDKGKELLEELENLKSESARQLDNLKQTSRTKLEEVLSEREKLTNSHQELVQQIAVLQTDADSKHQSLLEQVQILSEEKEKLKNFISDLEEQLTSVTTAASEEKQVLEEKYEDVMKERNKLAETLEAQQKQLNLLQEESNSNKQTSDGKFQEAIKEKNQLKESLDLLEKHVETMKKEHENDRTALEEKFQEAIKERSQVEESLNILEKQMESMKKEDENERKALEEKFQEAIKERSQVEESLNILEKQMESMKKEDENERKTSDEKFQEAIKERNQLVESLNLLEKQMETLKKEHETERKTSDDNFQEAIKERNQLVESLNVFEKQMEVMKKEHENEKRELQSKFEELEKETADLKCQSEQQTESMEEMTSQNFDKLESLKSQVSNLEKENEQLKGKNQTLEESLAGFKKETGEIIEDTNQKLSKETEQFQKTEAELKESLSTATKTTEQLKAEMEKTVHENKQLKSKLEQQAEKEKQHDSQRFEELEVYKNRVASLVVENEQLQSHKKDLELSSDELKRQLEEVLEYVRQKRSTYSTPAVKGREECKNIMEENKTLSENLKELEKKTVDLTTQAIELTSTKMQETEESSKVRLENRKLNAKVPILERQVNDLLDEIAPLRKKNNELTAEKAELSETLKRENSMRDDFFKQQTDMAEEIADLKQQIDALSEKKEEAEAKVVTLEEEMEKVKGQLVEERENREKLKAKKEEPKVEKKIEKPSEEQQAVPETREEKDEEEGDDDDDADEEENCEVYTLDDLEDGLEEEGDEGIDQKLDEQKELSRISFAEPASTDTSRVEVDATPLMKRKKGRGAKAKKRKSVDILDDEPDMVVSKKKKKPSKEVVAPRRQTRGMSRAKRAKTVPIHFEEQENIPEERPSPGAVSTTSTDSTNKRGAFSKLGDMLQNSPLGRSVHHFTSDIKTKKLEIRLQRVSDHSPHSSISPTKYTAKRLVNNTTTSPAAKSPPKVVEIQMEGKRRKRKLFKTDISAPFECSPFETVKIGDSSTMETNQRVTRSLRSRSKKTNN